MDKYNISAYTDGDKLECSCVIDKSGHNGVLMFTHEISIDFSIDKDNNIEFQSAWVLNCGEEFAFESAELNLFNETYPGLWDDISAYAKDKSHINVIDNKVTI